MITITEQNLQEALTEAGFKARIEEKSKQVAASIMSEKREYPLFCRILADGELIQLIVFVPVSVEEKGVNDLSRFLHMANKELDMPGFCVDEQSKTVFYRVVIPTLGKKLSKDVLTAYLRTMQNVVDTFGTIVVALAIGAMTMEQIMEMSQKQKNA